MERRIGPASRDEQERRQDPRFWTADNVFITDGLLVIDYDMKPHRFLMAENEREIFAEYWDGWFRLDGQSVNGERMATRDPQTRRAITADDVRRGETVEAIAARERRALRGEAT